MWYFYYVERHSICDVIFSLIFSFLFKENALILFKLNPLCVTTRRHMWKKSFDLFMLYIFGGALRKEPHMAAVAKGSSNSYVAWKHFVTWRINLIHYMLNNFEIEFKELFFSYFFTGITHRCFSTIFVKVYIVYYVMAILKRYKKTSLVTLLSFSQ